MDLAKELRTAETKADEENRALAAARRALDLAAANYNRRRKYAPTGHITNSARLAWGMALGEWASALIRREKAIDEMRAERRTVDDKAEVALCIPTEKPLTYNPHDDPLPESP